MKQEDKNMEAEESRRASLDAFYENQARQVLRGRRIVMLIGWVQLASTLLSFFFNHNVLSLILNGAFGIGLLCSVPFIRWLFAILCATDVFFAAYLLVEMATSLSSFSGQGAVLLLIAVVPAIFWAISCALLIANRNVDAYFYAQNH